MRWWVRPQLVPAGRMDYQGYEAMSIINQMLRDLDARGTAPAAAPSTSARRVSSGGRLVGVAALVGSVGVCGVAAYLMMRDEPLRAPEKRDGLAQPRVADDSAVATAAKPVAPPVSRPLKTHQPTAHARELPATDALTGAKGHDRAHKPPEPHAQATQASSAIAPSLTPVLSRPVSVSKVPAPSPEIEAQQLFDDAQAMQRAGNTADAINFYQQALARNPSMQQARLALAALLRDSGRSDEALALLQAGYALRAHPAIAVMAGRMLADLGQREDALVWLARARDNLRPADLALMGALNAQLQRHDESIHAYQRALVSNPAQGGWLLGLGVSLEAAGRLDEARTAYRDALEHGRFKPEVEKFLRERSHALNP